MVGASKILTVSYGTFSCTLEGFDDPFNTMKAIAEYFRDLAAEDRYFGAEPPTPDAAMLHRIAEREIQRRVEAKIQENGVILRAEETAPAAAPAVALAPAAPPAPVAPPPAAPAPAAAAPAAAAPAESESVAAKLSRIRSAVVQARNAARPAPVAAAVPLVSDYIEDEHAESYLPEEDSEAVAALIEAEEALPEAFAPEAPDEITEEVAQEASFAAAVAEADLAEEPQAEAAPEAPAAVEAAADLPPEDTHPEAAVDDWANAVRAEAEFGDAPAVADHPATAEDDLMVTLATLVTAPEAEVEEAAAEASEAEPAALAPAPDLADLPAEVFGDELSGLLATLAVEAEPQPAAVIEDDEAFAEDAAEEALEAETFGAEVFADEDLVDAAEAEAVTEIEAADATGPAEAEEATLAAVLAEADAAPAAKEAAEVAPQPEEPAQAVADKIQRARARVIKIRRIEPTTAAPAPEAPAAAAEPVSALSPEDEADLLRELAEVEREASPTPPAAEVPAKPVVVPRPVRPVRHLTPRPAPVPGPEPQRNRLESPEDGEAAVSRLIAQTNSQMEGAENRRRLSAIAHLKAAVAATVAERLSGGARAATEAERIDPYRADLSRIVRPSQTAPKGQRERPSPLVLVSELRVDRRPDETAPRSVSPTQIHAVRSGSAVAAERASGEDEDEAEDDAALIADTKGFAEFADRLGAHGLPALLEAAAAYVACVEGRPHFSRPQLMRQIGGVVEEDEASREDALRGFGNLLRAGKIAKVKRGQYALTEASHYLSEARKLVG